MKIIFALSLFLTITCAFQMRGVNYGFQMAAGNCPPYEWVLRDFEIIATYAQGVKIFSLIACDGAEYALRASQTTGLKIFFGMNADDDFPREMAKLQQVAGMFPGLTPVIGVTVGSENLYRDNSPSGGQLTSDLAARLANQITQVQGLLRSIGASQIPVTHTDVFFKQPQEILDVADILMFNAFSFWEGVSVENGDAIRIFIEHYNHMKFIGNGKTIWIGETGWPNAGMKQAYAVPSIENQQRYLQDFVCWANSVGAPYFWFEAFDELWKHDDIERSFGLYDYDRRPKTSFNIDCSKTPYPNGAEAPTTPFGNTFASNVPRSTSSTTSSTTTVMTSSTTFTAPVAPSTADPSAETSQSTTSDDVIIPGTSNDVITPNTSSVTPVTPTSQTPEVSNGDGDSETPGVGREQGSGAVLYMSLLSLTIAALFA